MGLFLYLSSPYLISSVPVHYHRMPSSLFFSLYLKLLSNSEKLDSHTCKEGVDAMVFQWQWLQLVYRSWCLNIIFNYKNLGLLGGMANFRVELWDPQNEPGIPYFKNEGSTSKNYKDLSRRHRSLLRGTSTGQIWDNLNIEINYIITYWVK